MIYEDVLQDPDRFSFLVPNLGPCQYDSPVTGRAFVQDDELISFSSQLKNIKMLFEKAKTFPAFQKAGPRQKIFFNPKTCKAACVTCGGLCPGMNNVIQAIVTVLHHEYGVESVLGFRYGYNGLLEESDHPPITLTPQLVDTLHKTGGTLLGSSRGFKSSREIVDTLQKHEINLLFCVGGDGTLRAANDIVEEIGRRGAEISIIGIPKTVDCDLRFVEKTFGFDSAVDAASDIITGAHCEAEGAERGISIVKVMGRDSGFIAAGATLANPVVDFCLIPEVPFTLERLLPAIGKKLEATAHAVIVVAEGAGQDLFKDLPQKKDASGNILKHDIGIVLHQEIEKYFQKSNNPVTVKWFNPSYYIRSVPAIPSDAIFCYLLAENAIHAAMCGKTGIAVGYWNNFFTHVPLLLTATQRRQVDLDGALWKGVLSATQQESYMC